jgi:hypothetical protein
VHPLATAREADGSLYSKWGAWWKPGRPEALLRGLLFKSLGRRVRSEDLRLWALGSRLQQQLPFEAIERRLVEAHPMLVYQNQRLIQHAQPFLCLPHFPIHLRQQSQKIRPQQLCPVSR